MRKKKCFSGFFLKKDWRNEVETGHVCGAVTIIIGFSIIPREENVVLGCVRLNWTESMVGSRPQFT
jgi:hypothetical protein